MARCFNCNKKFEYDKSGSDYCMDCRATHSQGFIEDRKTCSLPCLCCKWFGVPCEGRDIGYDSDSVLEKRKPQITRDFVRIQREDDETDQEWKERARLFSEKFYKIPELREQKMELTVFKSSSEKEIKLKIKINESIPTQTFKLNLRFPNDVQIRTPNRDAYKLQIFAYRRNSSVLLSILPEGTPNSHDVELRFGNSKTVEIQIPKGY